MTDYFCPICYGAELGPFRGRKIAACTRCGSLERTRVIYSLFLKLGLLRPELKVLHIAPDPSLINRFHPIYQQHYLAADIRPGAFKGFDRSMNTCVLDVANVSEAFQKKRFDVILHSHVMEHVRGSWQLALLNLTSLLNPNGYHIFAVPIGSDWSKEDLSELTNEQRKNRFGQADHVRIIGRNDFHNDMRLLSGLADLEYFRAAGEILPESAMRRMAGDRDVYVMKRRMQPSTSR